MTNQSTNKICKHQLPKGECSVCMANSVLANFGTVGQVSPETYEVSEPFTPPDLMKSREWLLGWHEAWLYTHVSLSQFLSGLSTMKEMSREELWETYKKQRKIA